MNILTRNNSAWCLLAVLAIIIPSPGANLLFHSGFEANTGLFNTVLTDITGTDNSVSPPNNWDNISFRLTYSCGEAADRWAKIVDDPTRPGNRILHFWLKKTERCNSNTRIQSIVGNRSELFQRVRMYLHPDMLKLIGSGLDENEWFMFQEYWIRPNWTGEPNSFRMSFNLSRGMVGNVEKYYWKIDANECCAGMTGQDGTVFWEVKNTKVQVPIGEWFTAETYYRKGDQNTGRIVFTIQREGRSKETIADITDWTYHPEENPRGLYTWNAHKLYVRPDNVDYVREHDGALQIYWDDWEVWDTFPSTAPDTTPPSIRSVTAPSNTVVRILFDEAVEAVTAENINNYIINNGITVSAAHLESDATTVVLKTSSMAKNAIYTLTVSGIKDRAVTPNIMTTAQINFSWTDCLSSSASWQNFSMTSQNGRFEVTYDATPLAARCNGLVTFSKGPAMEWNDCAVLVRFNEHGKIDARNGGNYQADRDISYAVDTTYHFRVAVDIPDHTYSVYVTPLGGTEMTLAADYAFRSEQSGVTELDNWNIIDDTGSFSACDMVVNMLTGIDDLSRSHHFRTGGYILPVGEKIYSLSGIRLHNKNSGHSGIYILEERKDNVLEYKRILIIE